MTAIKDFVQKWMDGHEPDTFIKNKHGKYIYTAGPTSLDLPSFFEELLEDYISEHSALKEQEENNNPFSTLFPINGFRIDIIPNAGIGEKGVGKLFVHPDDYPKELVKK